MLEIQIQRVDRREGRGRAKRGRAGEGGAGEGGAHGESQLWLLLAWVLGVSAGEADVLHGPNAHLAQESETLRGGEGLAATNTSRTNQDISSNGSCFQPPDRARGSLL